MRAQTDTLSWVYQFNFRYPGGGPHSERADTASTPADGAPSGYVGGDRIKPGL